MASGISIEGVGAKSKKSYNRGQLLKVEFEMHKVGEKHDSL